MNKDTDMKSVVIGWIALAAAYVIGRKHGRAKCIGEVKDIVLNKFIEEKKEKEEGS